jgi:hypothetical protein
MAPHAKWSTRREDTPRAHSPRQVAASGGLCGRHDYGQSELVDGPDGYLSVLRKFPFRLKQGLLHGNEGSSRERCSAGFPLCDDQRRPLQS